MFTGGVGQIDANHLKKHSPKEGYLVIKLGGPAYRIGVGGGSASSLMQGENEENLDFNAVQRGDPEMEQKLNRVIRVNPLSCLLISDIRPVLNWETRIPL